mgnify:CR=1 FL=1
MAPVKDETCRGQDIILRHRGQNVGPGLHIFDGQSRRQPLTIAAGKTIDIVLRIDHRSSYAGLDTCELILVDAILQEIIYDTVHRLFDIRKADAFGGNDGKVEGRVVIRRAVVACVRIDCLPGFELKFAREKRGLRAATKQIGKDCQGRRRLLIARIALRGEIAARDIGLGNARVAIAEAPFGKLRWLLRALADVYSGGRFQGTVVFLCESLDLSGPELSRAVENRIVRRIICPIPSKRIGQRQRPPLLPPSHTRSAICVVSISRRTSPFAETCCSVSC